MDNINTYIGSRIKENREHCKLTQEYMAKELDIAPNHYGRIERGENSCTMYNLIKICNILKITPNDLVGNLIITNSKDFEENFNKLNIEDKVVVSKLTEFLISKDLF
ncbi:MAG: helix-turn-helix transcriptional regulator [Clostridia bacterium]